METALTALTTGPDAPLYRVIYGPAMDQRNFPFTDDGLLSAWRFKQEMGAAILCDPTEACPENPTGLSERDLDILEELEELEFGGN